MFDVRDQPSTPLSSSTKRAPPRAGLGRREPTTSPRTGCLSASHERRERCFSRPLQPTLRTTTTRELSDSGVRSLSRGAIHRPARMLQEHQDPLDGRPLAFRQTRPPVGQRLTAFAELPSLFRPAVGVCPYDCDTTSVQWATSATRHRRFRPRARLRERRLASLSRRKWRRRCLQALSSPEVTRPCARQHARPTPLQDAFHRKEPKGQEV